MAKHTVSYLTSFLQNKHSRISRSTPSSAVINFDSVGHASWYFDSFGAKDRGFLVPTFCVQFWYENRTLSGLIYPILIRFFATRLNVRSFHLPGTMASSLVGWIFHVNTYRNRSQISVPCLGLYESENVKFVPHIFWFKDWFMQEG